MRQINDDFTLRLTPVQISAGSPASVQIYDFMRDTIIRGDIMPDTLLSEKSLCTWLGVSRQPVREALLRLTGVSLIKTYAQRGSVVTRISPSRVNDAQLIREAVEVEVLRRGIKRLDTACCDSMRKEIALQETFLAHNDHDGFYRSDEALHKILGRLGGLPDMSRDLEVIKVQLDRVRYLTLRDRTRMQALLDDHTCIVDAMMAGDDDAAVAALRTHLRRVLGDLVNLNVERPEFFAAPTEDKPSKQMAERAVN